MEKATRTDLNTADFEKLVEIPGIAEVLARRIIETRPFDTFDDVVRVRGIGPTSIQGIAHYATVGNNYHPIATGDETMETEETRFETIEISPEDEIPTAAPEEVPADLIPLPPLPPVEPWVEDMADVAADEEPETAEALVPPPIPEELLPVELPAEEEEESEAVAEETHVEPLPAILETEEEEAPVAPLPIDIEVETEAEAVPIEMEEAPSEVPETETPPAEAPEPVVSTDEKPAPKLVKRGQLIWTSILILFLAMIAAVALSLGILAGFNNGELIFARPNDVMRVSRQVDALAGRADTLEQTLDSVQSRLDNLEALSGRIDALESDADEMQGAIDTLASQTETLDTQVQALNQETEALGQQMEDVQAQTGRFQAVMDGLRDLLNNLFPTE